MTNTVKHMPMGWQTMETAPKDGTPILACIEYIDEPNREVWWNTHILVYDSGQSTGIDLDHERGWRWEDYLFWMPLPPPPGSEPSTTTHQAQIAELREIAAKARPLIEVAIVAFGYKQSRELMELVERIDRVLAATRPAAP